VKPEWLKKRLPTGSAVALYATVDGVLKSACLHTVCTEAKCPNRGECWGSGTATFLLMGDICTRHCRFCATKKGKPSPLDLTEPERIASVAKGLALKHVVLTSVDRDDLPDGGASHFSKCIAEIKKAIPAAKVEVLVPDFAGSEESIRKIISASPEVFAHNIEVVENLQSVARDRRANYRQSLNVLKMAKEISEKIITKSSLMVGLGETDEEVLKTMDALLDAGVDLLTIGQYLQPARHCLPVKKYVPPEKFEWLKQQAEKKGFTGVVSGPFVRSSYHAKELFERCVGKLMAIE